MRFSKTFIALSVPFLVSAAPARLYSRQAAPEDILVLKFAHVLEQLEAKFYADALAKFQVADFTAAGFTASQIPIEQFTVIGRDEGIHATVLEGALRAYGEEPLSTCTFNFDSVLGDVQTMAAVARIVETVGVGAYIGASTIVKDKVLLSAAASILTTEARHETILNIMSGTGSAIPTAFDLGFTPPEVLAMAGPFIAGCDLGVPANPVLQITNTGAVGPGTKLEFASPALEGVDRAGLFCQMLVPGRASSIPMPFDNCVVPDINGPVALFITSDTQPLINNAVQRTAKTVIAGPTLAFIDTIPETLGQLVRGGSGAPVRASVSTRTISPSEASSIIAAATQAGGAGAAVVTSTAATTSASDAAATSNTAASSSVSTGSSTSPAPLPTSANQSLPPTIGSPGGPSAVTGPSKDGRTNIIGWSNVPSTP